jgi:hypothetical protein
LFLFFSVALAFTNKVGDHNVKILAQNEDELKFVENMDVIADHYRPRTPFERQIYATDSQLEELNARGIKFEYVVEGKNSKLVLFVDYSLTVQIFENLKNITLLVRNDRLLLIMKQPTGTTTTTTLR